MTGVGGPEVLELREVPEPALSGPHDLRVRVKAAGVNPVDTKLRSCGTYFPDNKTPILGCDGAGVVEAVGSAVTRFAPGDEVWYCNGGIGGHPGSYAEYSTVDERFAAHKPKRLSFVSAAAAPLVLITAWEALFDRARLQTGQRVLIHAGAGGVGHVAIQLAVNSGAQVATTVGSADKADFVTLLGAERVIRYRDADFVQETLDWSEGVGADVVFDTVGGETFERSFAATRIYGDLVTLLQPAADTDWSRARNRNLRISLELMLAPMAQGLVQAQSAQAMILEQCARMVEAGALEIDVRQVLPLSRAAEAHALIEAGGMLGKMVLDMQLPDAMAS